MTPECPTLPDRLIDLPREVEAIAEADTLLLTVPNQLGVEYNVHVIEAILTHVALGWGGGRGLVLGLIWGALLRGALRRLSRSMSRATEGSLASGCRAWTRPPGWTRSLRPA